MIGGHIFGIPVEENLPYLIPALPSFVLWFKVRKWRREQKECICNTEVCCCGKDDNAL